MTHPSSLDLEAFAAEGATGASRVATHVGECSACAAFVESLRDLLATGPSTTEADDAVARALARVSAHSGSRGLRPLAPRDNTKPGRLWLVTSSVVVPLAAAAAILAIQVRGGSAPSDPEMQHSGASAPASAAKGDRLLMGPAVDPDTRFKGAVQVAVVRERGGQQERFSSVVRVRPGDRLRVEVALDREQAILGGVLADDGSFLELMPEGVRGAGTHFSERSAKVDASPTRGTILIGSPEAVAHARQTKQWTGVITLRVEMEQEP